MSFSSVIVVRPPFTFSFAFYLLTFAFELRAQVPDAQPPRQPGIIVKLIETPHDPTGLSDAIIGAIGLTGAILLAALVTGILVGGIMFFVRSRHPLS